ncbi:MAG: UrcA family protein [Sphingomicrobium sp.]
MKIFLALGLAASLSAAAPALAEAPTAGADIQLSLVRTADLDLGSESGQRVLDQRLANAAREVCGIASDVDIKGKNAVRACRDETLTKARAQRATVLAAAERGALIAVTASR